MKRLLAILALAVVAAFPAAQSADAASKRQPKIAVCHYDDVEDQYVRIHVALRAWESKDGSSKGHGLHEFDVLGDGVDCSALPDPTPDPA
jgi:Ni/Co efflux regulator RcnB